MSKILSLNLKKKWFDLILSGKKTEEYREIKPFWCARFILINGEKKSFKYWVNWFSELKHDPSTIIQMQVDHGIMSFIDYSEVSFLNGMTPPVPQFMIKLNSIEIKEGNKKWGAEPFTNYFTLTLGRLINSRNIKDELSERIKIAVNIIYHN